MIGVGVGVGVVYNRERCNFIKELLLRAYEQCTARECDNNKRGKYED